MKQKIFSQFDLLLLLFLATPLVLFWAYSFIKNQQTAARLSAQVEGEVVDFVCTAKSKVYPVVFYTAQNGHKYQYEASVAVPSSVYALGQKITVHYNPHNPKDARADGMYYCWAPVLAGTIIWSFLSFLLFISQYKPPRATQSTSNTT